MCVGNGLTIKPQRVSDWALVSPYRIARESNVKVIRTMEMISNLKCTSSFIEVFLSLPNETLGKKYVGNEN